MSGGKFDRASFTVEKKKSQYSLNRREIKKRLAMTIRQQQPSSLFLFS